jgi:hypothetical protein
VVLFAEIGQGFWDLGTWFGTIGYRTQGDPNLDYIVGYPCRQAASICAYISARFYDLDSWQGTVYTDPDTIVSDIQSPLQGVFDILGYTASQMWYWVWGFLGWNYDAINELAGAVMYWGRATLEYYYEILTMGPESLVAWIQDTITATWEILTKDPQALVEWIWPVLEPLVGAGGATIDAIWNWITDGPLQGWIDAWWSGMSSAVVGVVEGSIEYLMHAAFSTLEWSWYSFYGSFTWLSDRLIQLITEQGSHFAGPLWSLLETILSHVETRR